MHARKSKIISFILAILLFLTGTYLDTVAEDAFFLCDSIGDISFCPKSLHTDINNSKIYEREMLNECGSMEQQSIELSPYLSLLHANRVSPSLGKAFRYLETIQPFCQTLDGLVTNYMHQSDGKKRN